MLRFFSPLPVYLTRRPTAAPTVSDTSSCEHVIRPLGFAAHLDSENNVCNNADADVGIELSELKKPVEKTCDSVPTAAEPPSEPSAATVPALRPASVSPTPQSTRGLDSNLYVFSAYYAGVVERCLVPLPAYDGPHVTQEMRETDMNGVSMLDFVRGLCVKRMDAGVYIMASILIARVVSINGCCINNTNAKRMALIAIVVAYKLATDMPFKNEVFAARSGFFDTDGVNAMEVEFLRCINFELSVPEDVYRANEKLAHEQWGAHLRSRAGSF